VNECKPLPPSIFFSDFRAAAALAYLLSTFCRYSWSDPSDPAARPPLPPPLEDIPRADDSDPSTQERAPHFSLVFGSPLNCLN